VRGRGARLRGRDLDILLALAKMRLLRTSEVARLFFSAIGTCQKRLRRLFDAGLVRAIVTGIADENRFALTRLGHVLLCEALREEDIPPYRAAPRTDGRSVEHLDMLNRYRIGPALGLRASGLVLGSFVPDWELRARDPVAALVPDALTTILDPSTRNTGVVAVEVDNNTETPSIVLKKVVRYRERRALGQTVFGVVPDVVVFVVRTERRARTLARQLHAAGGEGSAPIVLLGLEAAIREDGGVSKGLRRPKDILDVASGAVEAAALQIGLRALVA